MTRLHDPREAASLLSDAFLHVLNWTIFWAALTAMGVVSLLDDLLPSGPLMEDRIATAFFVAICVGTGCFTLGLIGVGRQAGIMGALERLGAETEWKQACRYAWYSLVGAFLAPVAPVVLLILYGLATMNRKANADNVFHAAAWLVPSFFCLGLSAWHLYIGRLCAMVGDACGDKLIQRHARQVVWNWRILLTEQVATLAIVPYLFISLGETWIVWTLVVAWLAFVVYCFMYLLALLGRTVGVLRRQSPPAGQTEQ